MIVSFLLSHKGLGRISLLGVLPCSASAMGESFLWIHLYLPCEHPCPLCLPRNKNLNLQTEGQQLNIWPRCSSAYLSPDFKLVFCTMTLVYWWVQEKMLVCPAFKIVLRVSTVLLPSLPFQVVHVSLNEWWWASHL